MIATIPKSFTVQQSYGVMIQYYLHRADLEATVWLVLQFCHQEAYAHPSNHVPIKISFSNFLGSNLSMMATLTFVQSRPMNMLIALD